MSPSFALAAGVALAAGTALLLGACGAGGRVGAAPRLVEISPTPTVVPEPSPTPSPRPTATAAPTPTPTVFAINANVLAKLPDGWDPVVVVANQDRPTADAPPGGRTGPLGESANRWSYTGVLGRLKPKQAVVPAVAEAPTAVPNAAPLTGLPGPAWPDRPAVIIKIDNVAPARPQTGLNEADIVYEEMVESGVTRFAAVFHSQQPEVVGPVRSGRSTDIGIVDSFSKPVFAFSGANSIYERLIDKQPIVNRGAEVYTGYWRNSSRTAPNNLFTSTVTMSESSPDGKAPRAHFAYREPGEALHPSAQPAQTVQLLYLEVSGRPIRYEWNAEVGGWKRWQSGTAHVDASGVQLAPQNLIVQFVSYLDSGLTDKFGEDLYEGVSVGSGTAWVFTEGHIIEAIWTRPTLESATTFTDLDGQHIELTPGQTFVSLIAPGGASWG